MNGGLSLLYLSKKSAKPLIQPKYAPYYMGLIGYNVPAAKKAGNSANMGKGDFMY